MNKLTIVKIGGKIVEDDKRLNTFLKDFSTLEGYKILIHGGGRSATRIASALGIESKLINGRRITDGEMIKIVTMVYAGLVNKNIVAKLQSMSQNALGLTGADMNYMLSEKRPLINGIDYGYVGDVKKVDANIISKLLTDNVVPVLSPITHDKKGNLLNTNADTIAGETAKALSSLFEVTLIYCFEKKGVLMDETNDDSVINNINKESYKDLVSKGIIKDGMIPKLDNAFESIDNGVKKVIITEADSLINNSCGTVIE